MVLVGQPTTASFGLKSRYEYICTPAERC